MIIQLAIIGTMMIFIILMIIVYVVSKKLNYNYFIDEMCTIIMTILMIGVITVPLALYNRETFTEEKYNITKMAEDYHADKKHIETNQTDKPHDMLIHTTYMWFEDWTLYEYDYSAEKYEEYKKYRLDD